MASIHSLTLGDVLREHRRTHAARTALICGNTRLTYAELDARVNRLAGALAAAGFGPGDRLAWLGQNCHRILEMLLAAAKLGGMMCPANWRGSAAELAFVVDDLNPRVVVWQEEEIGAAAREARELSTAKATWLQHDGGEYRRDVPHTAGRLTSSSSSTSEYEAFLASGADRDPMVVVDPSDGVLILYTAAFGGRPNGAMLSHHNLLTQSMLQAFVQEIDPDYVFCNSGPLFHMGTFMMTIPTFHMAGTNVIVRRADAEELCRVIQDERCNGAFLMGPTIAEMIVLNSDGRYNLKSLRAWPGGAPEWVAMTSPDESRWGRLAGGYGQTEVMGLATFKGLGPPSAGSHGKPSPLVEMRIVDATDDEIPPGEVGEIVVRGPTVTAGYWNRPDLNADRMRGGWWHTNDLGRREADGSLTFIGPKTQMIKSAAENIYAAEVEACIEAHPSVREAAVIGVPDPKWHQSVKAIVVLHDAASVSEDEIIEWCKSRIASYKKPRSVEFATESLPRLGMGKDYATLDARYGGGNYPGTRPSA